MRYERVTGLLAWLGLLLYVFSLIPATFAGLVAFRLIQVWIDQENHLPSSFYWEGAAFFLVSLVVFGASAILGYRIRRRRLRDPAT